MRSTAIGVTEISDWCNGFFRCRVVRVFHDEAHRNVQSVRRGEAHSAPPHLAAPHREPFCLLDYWAAGLLDYWTTGLPDYWTTALLSRTPQGAVLSTLPMTASRKVREAGGVGGGGGRALREFHEPSTTTERRTGRMRRRLLQRRVELMIHLILLCAWHLDLRCPLRYTSQPSTAKPSHAKRNLPQSIPSQHVPVHPRPAQSSPARARICCGVRRQSLSD